MQGQRSDEDGAEGLFPAPGGSSRTSTWRFPRAFWTANIVEFLERTAYYGMFIALTLYLTNVVGFGDINAAWIGGLFAGGLYLLPPFSGALADTIGFRRSLLMAFVLLTLGYATLGFLPYKATVLPALVITMVGGSFIKVVVTGTIAKTTGNDTRARAYSIFYGIVNIGAFAGKGLAYPVRLYMGLEAINLYAASLTLLACACTFFFFHQVDSPAGRKSLRAVLSEFRGVVTNLRLLTLILIVTGFWVIQQQMYATMPKYILRTVGTTASPEWIANVNPFIVITTVMLVTHLMKKAHALTSMIIGMAIMPISALCMAFGGMLEGRIGSEVSLVGVISAHPITLMLVIGVTLQGLAECFLSPRYLEFFSRQAPSGQEAMYLGFAHLHSFLASVLGFGLSGYLLSAYCPDPRTLRPDQMAHAYDSAHLIWFYFAAIGVVATVALIIYGWRTARIVPPAESRTSS
jgi:dipeptide/tripeptide permease